MTIASSAIDGRDQRTRRKRAEKRHRRQRGRFVAERGAAGGGDRFEMLEVGRDQRLVGGDDRGAAPEQARHQRARGLNGAERLDHHVVVAAQERRWIRGDAAGLRTAARLVDVADERLFNLKTQARMRGRRAIRSEASHGLADLAEAEDADPNGPDGGAANRLLRADAQRPGGGWCWLSRGSARRFSSLPVSGRELAPRLCSQVAVASSGPVPPPLSINRLPDWQNGINVWRYDDSCQEPSTSPCGRRG